ncbi:Vacuolar protein sorting-associated protein 62 [Colletotrichum trifolii]|uniref:Vacuolar protein sorting-associated protein 62 n=1 Tax=Colletotrichum trifolii TaxID=5466 RepID=A0A4R8QNU7_COLTR|nr:Vacuolar protein sorting-associated protein 62 [Colletotrichum trifolii]
MNMRGYRDAAHRHMLSASDYCASLRRFLPNVSKPTASRTLRTIRRFLRVVFLPIFLVLGSLWFLTSLLPRILNPTPPDEAKQRWNEEWISSSPYWLDRQACRWVSLCGVHHVKWDSPTLEQKPVTGAARDGPLRLELRSLDGIDGMPDGWKDSFAESILQGCKSKGRNATKAIPDYVWEYAPLVYLHSEENFWPADIAEHVRHMNPHLDGEPLNQSVSLSDLHLLDERRGSVFLTSKDDVESRPEWLHSHVGIPEPSEQEQGDDATASPPKKESSQADDSEQRPLYRISDPRRFRWLPSSAQTPADKVVRRQLDKLITSRSESQTGQDGRSAAPATLVIVEKEDGIVDAFWFFFYAYNLGQTVLGMRFGNHVGDWEHSVVRFQHGKPRAVFLSEHAAGQVYTYEALEKRGVRPVLYSAVGSHAMYPNPGNHPYVLPFNMLKDVTDRGHLWDPAKNTYSYWYDPKKETDVPSSTGNRTCSRNPDGFTPSAENPDAPTSWLSFMGAWGDNIYPLADARQWRLFNQYHYDEGPYGPKLKNLERRALCLRGHRCNILEAITPGQKWYD